MEAAVATLVCVIAMTVSPVLARHGTDKIGGQYQIRQSFVITFEIKRPWCCLEKVSDGTVKSGKRYQCAVNVGQVSKERKTLSSTAAQNLETAFLIPERANKPHWTLTQPGSCSKSLMSLAGNSSSSSRSTNRGPNKGGKKAPLRWACAWLCCLHTSTLWSRLRGPGFKFQSGDLHLEPKWTGRDLIVPFRIAVGPGPRAKPGLSALDPCLLMVDAATRELS